jgi:hypothetical protein
VIPRTCDDDRCDYDDTGWVHDVGCAAQAQWGSEDMALTEARVDGYARPYGVRPGVHASTTGVAA